jgi:hypothetical protein
VGPRFQSRKHGQIRQRAGKKDNIVQDLEKARWYLDREIANLKAKAAA